MSGGAEFAAGLRRIADWYEAHPDAPTPVTLQVAMYGTVEGEREAAMLVARALAPCEKRHDPNFITLVRDFGGGAVLHFQLWRASVCTKRVVGHVTKKAVFVPEHDEEVVEWDCHPLLAAEPPPAPPEPEPGDLALAAVEDVAGAEARDDEIPF